MRGLAGLREEGMGNLLGYEGRGITSVEEGLGEVSGVGVEVIWVTAETPPPRWPESRELSVWWMKGGSWKNGGIAGGW